MPWAFWRLTPAEFLLMLYGYLRREDRAWQRTGMLGLWVLAPYRPAHQQQTVDELLGRRLRVLP